METVLDWSQSDRVNKTVFCVGLTQALVILLVRVRINRVPQMVGISTLYIELTPSSMSIKFCCSLIR